MVKLWGIDLGGTKIEGAILDPDDLSVAQLRLRVPTEAGLGYEKVLESIGEVVRRLEEESGQKRPAVIGVGTPGVIEPSTSVLKNSNTTCLNGKPLLDDLRGKLGVDVRMANDANCFALAEATLGCARGEELVMGLILGSGVGGGIVWQGQIWNGVHGIAGEWGHNPLLGESHPCYCGRRGCIETVISGKSLERWFRERTGEDRKLPEVVTMAEQGHSDAQATLDRLREKFGEAIAAVINILDPSAIVIGGGVGNLDLLYQEETRAAILRHTFNKRLDTRLLKPALGDSAGVFGAAMLTSSSHHADR
ncbi:MAG: ROK family protein [Terrimicrobiaceae bacterium]